MSTLSSSYRVTILEWLAHSATIEATDAEAAETKVCRLWEENTLTAHQGAGKVRVATGQRDGDAAR